MIKSAFGCYLRSIQLNKQLQNIYNNKVNAAGIVRTIKSYIEGLLNSGLQMWANISVKKNNISTQNVVWQGSWGGWLCVAAPNQYGKLFGKPKSST